MTKKTATYSPGARFGFVEYAPGRFARDGERQIIDGKGWSFRVGPAGNFDSMYWFPDRKRVGEPLPTPPAELCTRRQPTDEGHQPLKRPPGSWAP